MGRRGGRPDWHTYTQRNSLQVFRLVNRVRGRSATYLNDAQINIQSAIVKNFPSRSARAYMCVLALLGGFDEINRTKN